MEKVLLRTAKDKFIDSAHAAPWREFVKTPLFEEAVNHAIVELMTSLPSAPDPAKGWDNNSQMQGALRFKTILANLAVIEEAPKSQTAKTLDYQAYERSHSRNG